LLVVVLVALKRAVGGQVVVGLAVYLPDFPALL
jgi:hypothetical protein